MDQDERIVLRIKDDCIPFDPSELAGITSPDDPVSNIGIRLACGLADEVSYQNLLGLNVVTVTLRKHSQRSKDGRKKAIS